MSTEVILHCWICPETFTKIRVLKDHAIGTHSVCKMVFPWCIHEESTLARMSELTNHTKRKDEDLVLDLLEGEFFTERNGFWLAKRPSEYIKIIKPTDWTTTIAIRTRASLLSWIERIKKEGADYEKYKKEWEDGWKKELGHSVTSHRARGKGNTVHLGRLWTFHSWLLQEWSFRVKGSWCTLERGNLQLRLGLKYNLSIGLWMNQRQRKTCLDG